MTTITLSQWGNCLALRVPKQVAEANRWKAGDQLEVTQQDDGFAVRKVRKVKKYDLEEILQGMESFPKEDVVDWGEPVGREVW
jgi:antitoxin MazE